LPEPSFAVDEWWRPGATIDLGGRTLRVLSTPGHTPSSCALYDGTRHWLFAGDFIYPGSLYAFLPGASRREYEVTTRNLLAMLDPATRIYAAHMADDPATVSAPALDMADLRALERTLLGIRTGELKPVGFYPRIYPVRGMITFATGYSWNNR
jgi:hydroxyacylglutathione hydrolase